MGVFRNWLVESVTDENGVVRTTMAEKVDLVGGVGNFRQLVDEYRDKAGAAYNVDDDPLFMDVDRFKEVYGGKAAPSA